MPRDVRCLVTLKNFIVNTIGLQDTKRVKKIYYRYPMEVYRNFHFKRYRLRDDKNVKLIRGWHRHFSTILLLELFVFLVDRCEGGSSEASVNTQSAGPASRNIRRMMVNLNESPDGSNEGFNYGVGSVPPEGMSQEEFKSHEGSVVRDPTTESFHLHPDQEDGRDKDEEELNSFRISQLALAQPAISQLYEYPAHFFHTES
ncbi:hypothetical protein PIB30_099318 [Stylosanthes scabra]|uniref:Uncharacterized protein n=1 Tax=Stylosanthes scabra TaxID=79078 RepID=A0ABU6UY06_9FABA|nr:hypothetical protein [Stylosanthes scabra]